jgi:type I restriction enzyme S subunit
MVPKGWKTVTLKDLLDGQIKNGYSPNATNSETGYWVLGLGALADEGIISSEIKPVLPEKKVLQSLLKKDDFLVSRSNTPDKVGRSIRFKNEVENCSYPDLMMRFRIDDNKADKEFIEHQLKSSAVRIYFKNCAAGSSSTMVKINKGILEKAPIVAPPIKEQKKIAQILSTWDKAISVTEKLLTNSQQQKKALMQQLLTGKKRLLDENGVRFSGEWEKGKFCDMANIDTGYAFKSKDFTQSDSGIPIIRMSDFKTGGLDVLGAAKVDRDSVNGLDKFKLRVGDFVFGMSGSLNNYGRVEKKDLPCYLNQRVGRILAKECANQAFITYLYLSDSIQQSILDKAAGAAQLNISISDLRSMVVYYPCIEEQQKIAAVLSAADAEISTLEKKLACLRDEKKALMQQLLTGKRRVKVDEAVAE